MGRALDPLTGSADAGFSLIELMVVIAITATLSLGAVMAVGGRAGPSDATRLQDSLAVQRDLAITGRAVRGLRLRPTGLTPMIRQGGDWQETGRERRWQGRIALVVDPPDSAVAPEVMLLPGGQVTPFSIRFEAGQTCATDGWQALACSGP